METNAVFRPYWQRNDHLSSGDRRLNGKLHTDLATTATGDKTVNDDGFA